MVGGDSARTTLGMGYMAFMLLIEEKIKKLQVSPSSVLSDGYYFILRLSTMNMKEMVLIW